ncbi:MAG: hypothetical protein IT460_04350 [Planctomycetes bacterium]|nr:hypothetical protein [Planctomycetota bacterium]
MSLRRRTVSTVLIALVAAGLVRGAAAADRSTTHPAVELLDAQGRPVLGSGAPVSPRTTCGACHDTSFVAAHGYHVAAGADERTAPGGVSDGRPFDVSPGPFGRWDPAAYRRLSLDDDERFDLGVADWVRTHPRHVGGGPAEQTAAGRPLAQGGTRTETDALDPATGRPVRWDWAASGTAEPDCFLCHLATPDAAARAATLARGAFRWAATATLSRTGLVEPDDAGGWRFVRGRFDPDGTAPSARLPLRNPTSGACGACHFEATDDRTALGAAGPWSPRDPRGAGQVFSSQRLRDSGFNLRDRETLDVAFDVHAARLVGCADCHGSPSDPARPASGRAAAPRHLVVDARRPSVGEHLRAPSHDFGKGVSSRGHAARAHDGTMRGCAECHDVASSHGRWLPHAVRHLDALACEACHVPRVAMPAVETTDWTVPSPDGRPALAWRGVEGRVDDPASLVVGYEPVLLPHAGADGRTRLVPHHLATTWYWVAGPTARPVRAFDLVAAVSDGAGGWHPDVRAALDSDHDGAVSAAEQRLDTPAKADALARRLVAVGVPSPRIEGAVDPTAIHHGVVDGAHAVASCEACHADGSRVARPFEVSDRVPAGAVARLSPDAAVALPGAMAPDGRGRLVYAPEPAQAGRWVLGRDRPVLVDRVGALALVATVLGVLGHGAARWVASRRRKEAP